MLTLKKIGIYVNTIVIFPILLVACGEKENIPMNDTLKASTTANIVATTTLSSPTPSSYTLTGTTQEFTWNYNGNEVNYWALYVGSTVGGYDYFSKEAPDNTTHITAVNLPTDGTTIHVRLWYRVNQTWSRIDTTYTAVDITPIVISTPTPNSTLTNTTQEFTWNYNGNEVNYWAFYVGSTIGGYDYYSKEAANNTNHITAVNLPTDGSTIHVRLWYRVNQTWNKIDTTYTTVNILPSVISTPTPNSTLTDITQEFTWDYNGNEVNYWAFYVGSTIGGYDYYSKEAANNTNHITAVNLPTDGSTIHVRLWYRVNQTWNIIDTTYTATIIIPATISSPIPNSILSDSTETFTWDYNGREIDRWAFYAGSTVGGYDYYSEAGTDNLASTTAINLPTDGSTIHIRLWYKVNQTWNKIDTTYTAAIPDADNDSISDPVDNCPNTPNQDQINTDDDEQGDACDNDDDNDGVVDNEDDFPLDSAKVTTYTKAHRLLIQASFGPSNEAIEAIMSTGITAWVNEQLISSSAYDSTDDAHKTHLERVIQLALTLKPSADWNENDIFNKPLAHSLVDELQMTTWWENSLGHPTNTAHGSDQLRQRVAYALSQILVVSNGETPLHRRGESLAFYYDLLNKNAFGNYRTLLSEISRSPAMGIYLSHQGNKKANLENATSPDENFARELIQLFSIGLHQLNVDGSPNRDGNANSYPDAGSNLIPSYTQQDVSEMAKVMTGWDLSGNAFYGESSYQKGDHTRLMEFMPSEHEDEIAESGDGSVTIMGTTFALNSGADGSGLDSALDILFQHDNIAPFISRHLIMRLVTSNPSSGYIARVSSIFNDNGHGVKGDLEAVVRAILLDDEARNEDNAQVSSFGKVKEPILALTQFLRAFHVRPLDGWTFGNSSTTGVYWYAEPEKHFGQAPMRSPSVFNFYAPDFIPVDDYFAQNKLVAPELQVQSNHVLLEINNSITSIMENFEKNKIEKLKGKTLAEYAPRYRTYNRHVLLIDFDEEMAIYEQALDGDTNGDFANMELTDPNTDIRYKDQAIDALLEHLDKVLLGETMSEKYHAAIKHFLLNATGTKSNNDVEEAWINIRDAVRFIVTSNAYMIQK